MSDHVLFGVSDYAASKAFFWCSRLVPDLSLVAVITSENFGCEMRTN